MEIADMKIAIIGAGNVATHIGRKLAETGFPVLQVFSRTDVSAQTLADEINRIYEKITGANTRFTDERVKGVKGGNDGKNSFQPSNLDNFNVSPCSWTNSIENVTSKADVYLVMLKDAVLDNVLPKLVKRNPKALFIHTAGSVPMDIWKGLAVRYGVLYPMQTFSKSRAVDFEQVHFFVEANSAPDLELMKDLANHLSSKVFEASSEQRKYLHLSAVFACNFTNHMYAICNKLLQEHGLPFSSMFPLIDETARKIHYIDPVDAQTGPAQRYDTNVMLRQEQLLTSDPQVAEIYHLISENIHAYEKGRKK